MKKLIAVFLFFLVSCAPNPLGLAEGEWVKHKIDGQKYYIVELRQDINTEDGGLVRVKNEFGEEINKDFAIFDFDRWVEPKSADEGSHNIDDLFVELRLARIALDEATQLLVAADNLVEAKAELKHATEARNELLKVIEETESVTNDSPVFKKRIWNPSTGKYEDR